MASRTHGPGQGGRPPGGVQSVATALELLDCLAAERELGVAELGAGSASPRAPRTGS